MTDIVKNKTFVITGETNTERDELKAEIMAYGGRVTISPSSKTDYLVIGNQPGEAKLKKSEELNIKQIKEDELMLMLEESKRCQSVEDIEFGIVEGLSENEIHKLEETKSKKVKIEKKKELENELWVEKYRPKKIEEFCGNKAGIDKLKEFLLTPINKLERKAILICGVPGIGKTTSAQLICKILNKNFLEFNASDVRNKNSVKDISSIGNTLNKNKIEHSVVIMDEVDGISDRGGLTELINFIKNTKVHIICIANEKNMKLKSLINYADEIHFRRLELRQIKNRITEILNLEGIKVNEIELNKLLIKGHGDFRFILNQLQIFAAGHLSFEAQKIENKSVFEVVMSIFHSNETKEKLEYFFEDPDFVPLLMQENYIKPLFYGTKPDLKVYSEAAEQLSLGEYNNSIKAKTQNYSFGYLQGYWTTRPTHKVGRCDFSTWLGQNSKRLKNEKLVKELHFHNGKRQEFVSKETYRAFYLPGIFKKIINFISDKKIDNCIEYLKDNGFVKDDIETLSIILDKKLADSRLLKLACNKNSWSFSYQQSVE